MQNSSRLAGFLTGFVEPNLCEQYEAFISQLLQEKWLPVDHVRWPFEIENDIVGSVRPDDARWLAQHIPGLVLEDECLSLAPYCSTDSPSVLALIAQALRDQGRLGKWRNELLRVNGDSGQTRGFIERAAVRPLGISTVSVNIIAYAANVSIASTQSEQEPIAMWVQKRAWDKDTDPGLWTTCAGGLAAGDESLLVSLAREVQEEAGFDLTALQDAGHNIVRRPSFRTRRNIPEGLLIEEVMCWDITLPIEMTPINQDGEVETFELWPVEKVIAGIVDQQFTTEAALIIHQSLSEKLAPNH